MAEPLTRVPRVREVWRLNLVYRILPRLNLVYRVTESRLPNLTEVKTRLPSYRIVYRGQILSYVYRSTKFDAKIFYFSLACVFILFYHSSMYGRLFGPKVK